MAPRLLSLPAELVDEILSNLDAYSLTQFGKTCSQAYAHLRSGHTVLWRRIFLNTFDDPRKAWARMTPTARQLNNGNEITWDWHTQLRRRLSARLRITNSKVLLVTRQETYEHDVNTLLDIIDTASPNHRYINNKRACSHEEGLNMAFIRRIFDVADAEEYIHDYCAGVDSPLAHLDLQIPQGPLTRARSSKRTVPENASRLHIYYGMTGRERSMRRAKGLARQCVYDWGLCSQANEWGPFKKDNSGHINWEMLEAISSLMRKPVEVQYDNFTICPENKPDLELRLDDGDWAGVTFADDSNCWVGTYAFLDYSDLVTYNASRIQGRYQRLEDFDEASGLLSRLCLHLDDSLKDDARFQTELPVCDDLPTLYFSGTSIGLGVHPSHAIGIRGSASLVPGGKEVRWRFIVRYAGSDQWQLEGVQPGGIRTGPIFGLWHGCDHAAGGPVGPFMYVLSDMEDLPILQIEH